MVKSMLPPEHHKVLANIRKAEARSKRKKLASEEQEESESEAEVPKAKSQRWSTVLGIGPLSPSYFYNSFFSFKFFVCFSIEDILAESDSDLSEDEGKAQKKMGRAQKGRAWLKEGEGDDPLNFLDPKVSQRVLCKTDFHLQMKTLVCSVV